MLRLLDIKYGTQMTSIVNVHMFQLRERQGKNTHVGGFLGWPQKRLSPPL